MTDVVDNKVYSYVRTYVAEHGWAPTIREIMDGIGLTSTATVHASLTRLSDTGKIERMTNAARAIRVTDED